MNRTILYAEVPSFYATVERARDPRLASRPVIVGGDPRKRGLVQSATPDALAAGVAVDQPMLEALERCPRAYAALTDMTLYREVSQRLIASLRRGFARLEPFGLGAAFFDASAARQAPEAIAQTLRERVRVDLELPLQVGIATSKFLARLAAEDAGRDAVRRIPSGAELSFLKSLPVSRLDGVGERTDATLAQLGVRCAGDVVAFGRQRLEAALGNHGLRILALAQGRDDSPVRAAAHPHSLSRETTIERESHDLGVIAGRLQELARKLEEGLALEGLGASKVTLKLRYDDLESVTRTRTASRSIRSAGEIFAHAQALLERTEAGSRGVRSVGISLRGLAPEGRVDAQLDLFSSGR